MSLLGTQEKPVTGGIKLERGSKRRHIGAGRVLLMVDNDLGTFLWHRLALARAARESGFDVHVATPLHKDAARLTEEGFTFHPIPMTRRGVNPFREVLAVLALFRLYRELKPDLIQHLRLKPVLYGTLAARLAKRPAVANLLTGLGYLFATPGVKAACLRRVAEVALRWALRHPNTTVLFENPDDRRLFVKSGLVEETKTVVIAGSGVDIDFFKFEPLQGSLPLVILASRMLWDKGIGEFVEAARRIAAQGIDARFALVGDTDPGNPKTISREQLQKWRDEGVVEWWGWRPDIQSVIARSHVVCLPSCYGEGIPRILIEAASCGRPLIATDAPGCREIVRDGVNGFLAQVRDVASLTEAMRRLLVDPELRIRMGKESRDLVLSRFSLEDVLNSNLAVYDDLLSQPGPRPVREAELINLLSAVSPDRSSGARG